MLLVVRLPVYNDSAQCLTLVPWRKGKSAVWDFTCDHSTAKSNVSKTSRKPGAAANDRETFKLSHYKNLAQEYEVIPIGVETLGGFGDSATSFINELGRRLTAVSGEKRATQFLRQRLSLCIQKGNAKCVLGSLPEQQQLTEFEEWWACSLQYLFAVYLFKIKHTIFDITPVLVIAGDAHQNNKNNNNMFTPFMWWIVLDVFCLMLPANSTLLRNYTQITLSWNWHIANTFRRMVVRPSDGCFFGVLFLLYLHQYSCDCDKPCTILLVMTCCVDWW